MVPIALSPGLAAEPTAASGTLNALSVDVEDYFMVSAFEAGVRKADWDAHPSRVEKNTRRILNLLDEYGAKATFFVVGWVGERFPSLIREIGDRGHEVACHGYYHQLVYELTPEQFRMDVRRSKKALETAAGVSVNGYRAPSFSINDRNRWAFQILEEEGFRYDASVLPAAHARGGFRGAPRFPHRVGGLAEFPMSVFSIAGRHVPFSGGGYFRLLPYPVVKMGLDRLAREGKPSIVYVHPWEFDPEQPRLRARPLDRFKHYVHLARTEQKFRRLLSDRSFATVQHVLNRLASTNALA